MKKLFSLIIAAFTLFSVMPVRYAALSPEYAPDVVLLTQVYCDSGNVIFEADIRHLSEPLSECVIGIDYNEAVLKPEVTTENGTHATADSYSAGEIILRADAAKLTDEINRLAQIQFAITGNGSFDINVRIISCKTANGSEHTLFSCLWYQKMFSSISERDTQVYLNLCRTFCSTEYVCAFPGETVGEFMQRLSSAAGVNFVVHHPGDSYADNGYFCTLSLLNENDIMRSGIQLQLSFGKNTMLSLTVVTVGDISGNDGMITSEDARAALRMSVGLETPSPAQRAAYVPLTTEEYEHNWNLVPTAALARKLLRIAVGRELLNVVNQCMDIYL